MSDLNFRITPEEFLREIGVDYKKGRKWLSVKYCLFCGSGSDTYSLNVHIVDGNFFCHRSANCGERGSFWKLIESQGRNPREYLDENQSRPKKTKSKKRFMYGRS